MRTIPTLSGISLALVTLLSPFNASAQVISTFIDPVITDPRITPLDDFPNASNRNLGHFVATDPGLNDPRLLLLWLPGSGGLPDDYETFATVAAEEGFDVVSIAYPNLPSVRDLTLDSTDLDLPERIRRERLFGETDQTDVIDVAEPDGVQNRLTRLLQHLALNGPGIGWGQYLNVDGSIRWNRVVVAGHSQGAGHAAYLGKEFPLAGAMYIAGPGDAVGGQTANWVFRPNVVDPSVCYGFTHWLDIGRRGFIERQQLLGLSAFGPIQNVDTVPAPLLSSHMLTTVEIREEPNFHSAVIADDELFLDEHGITIYDPTWRYMLSEIRAQSGACGGIFCVCNVADPGNQQIDVLDLLQYLEWWYVADDQAERTGNSTVTILDLLVFLDCWFSASVA